MIMDKKLMDCKLSNEEIIAIWNEIGFEENSFDYEEELLKAQLEKCKAYIDSQVQTERKDICSKLKCIDRNLDNSYEGFFRFRKMVFNLVKELEKGE